MNFSFTTGLLMIIFLPGLIYDSSLFSGVFARKKSFGVLNKIASSFIPGLILNVLWYLLTPFFRLEIPIKNISLLLIGLKDTNDIMNCFSVIESQFIHIFVYLLTLCIFSLILGIVFKYLIRKWALDIKFRSLRFASFRYYYLTGESKGFPDDNNEEFDYKQIGFALAYIMVESDSDISNLTYRGIVMDPSLYQDEENDAIYLINPTKYYTKLNESDPKKKVKKDFISGTMMIPFNTILNINVRYFKVERVPA